MNALIERNIRLFFRNKRGVLSSMISALVVIVLYVFFLGVNLRSALQVLGNIDDIVHLWTMSGFISVAAMTTTLSAMVIIIRDQESGCEQDFTCSPLTSWQIAGGYLISSYLVGVIMSVFSLCAAEIFLLCNGAALLSFSSWLYTLGAILLTTAASTAILFFLVSLFHSMQTFSAASSIIGTMSGFLTGIYVPIGSLPDAVQPIIEAFPLSHGAVLLRQTMMHDALLPIEQNAPADLYAQFLDELGIIFTFDGFTMRPWMHVLILFGTALFFYGCSVYVVMQRQKKQL